MTLKEGSVKGIMPDILGLKLVEAITAKEYEQPLEAGNGKKMDSPIEL